MQISNGDLTLNVAVDGNDDAPPVVLLHGITSSTQTWDWIVPALAERYRVIRLDFRGHGKSSRAPEQYRMPDYLTDAVAVCTQVAGRPCPVVGHSLGGGTAATLAQRHPDLVTALVLEDPPLAVTRDTTAALTQDNPLLEAFGLMRTSIPQLQESGISLDKLTEVLGRVPAPKGVPYGELLHQDGLVSMAAGMLDVDASVLDPVLENRMESRFDPTAPIPVPTLILPADPDAPDVVARAEHIEQVVASSPQVEVRVMEGSGHMVHDELDQRDVFLDEVTRFLARMTR